MVWRFTERWNVKSKSSSVLTCGNRAALTRCWPAVGFPRSHLLGQHRREVGLVVPAQLFGATGEYVGARRDARCLHRPGKEREFGGGRGHGEIPTVAS
jgi:hypothetical protein